MSVLVLWDIDNTLVRVGDVPHEIYRAAFTAAAGHAPAVEFAGWAGRTERGIAVEYLAANGLDPSGELVDLFLHGAAAETERLRSRIAEAGGRLAGAVEALKALAGVDARQTVVTGNVPATARIKLEVFGLDQLVDLDCGGYGHLETDRAHLVRRAVRLAGECWGSTPADHTVVIGDTPRDVRGALDGGVRAVAVATGHDPAEVLAAAGAHVVLPDLADTDAVLRAVGVS